jgi:preprotein translocase subunit SecA
MNQQRGIIYKQRGDVLNGEDISETIRKMIVSAVEIAVENCTRADDPHEWDFDSLRTHFMGTVTTEEDFRYSEEELQALDRGTFAVELAERALARYEAQEAQFGSETFREVERAVLLRHVDTAWMEHIDTMEELKSTVGLQSYAQKNPITEYRIMGADMFDAMVDEIRMGTVRGILSVMPRPQATERVQVANPINEGFHKPVAKKKVVVSRGGNTVVKDAASVGRNDPCPCGSGKKYKNCCLRTQDKG